MDEKIGKKFESKFQSLRYEEIRQLSSEVISKVTKGTSLSEIFKIMILQDKTLKPTDIFQIATHCFYIQNDAHGIVLLYLSLGLNQNNAVAELAPYLPQGRWRERIAATQLNQAEDLCGLPRDSLYDAFSGRKD